MKEQFYRTPEKAAKHLLADAGPREFSSVLEPSAGAGDLVRHIRSNKITCIEMNSERAAILRDQGHEVIEGDFLDWDSDRLFEAVIMNPPFYNQARHLLKAWAHVRPGGQLRALVNAASIQRPGNGPQRAVRELIKAHGHYEVQGEVFKNQGVEVDTAFVWLKKPHMGSILGEVRWWEEEAVFSALPDKKGNGLITYDLLDTICEAYMEAVSAHQSLMLYERIRNAKGAVFGFSGGRLGQDTYNGSVSDTLRERAWRHTVAETKIRDYMSSRGKKELDKLMDGQESIPFNKQNVLNLLDTLIQNRDKIIREAMFDVFEMLTREARNNRGYHWESWKTNDASRIEPKVIIYTGYESRHKQDRSGYYYAAPWERQELLNDIDRVMCFLDGKKLSDIKTIVDSFKDMNPHGDTNKRTTESTYFRLRLFGKGSLHMWFLRDDLRQDLNYEVGKALGWNLPERSSRSR